MEKGLFLIISGLSVLNEKFPGRIAACLKNHSHACKWGYIPLFCQMFGGFQLGDGDAVRYKVKKTKLKQNLMRSLPLTVKAFPGAW